VDLIKRVEDIFDIAAMPTATILSELFVTGVAGSIAPGAVNVMLAYKQKRSERMYEKFMIEVRNKSADFESRLEKLEAGQLNWFQEVVFPLVSDYVLENKQEEKIKYLVDGFLNAASMKITSEDILLLYYDTLDRLSALDLILLKNKSIWRDELELQAISRELVLDGSITTAQEKLRSYALLETRADRQTEALLKTVVSMSEHLSNPKKTFKPERLNTSFFTNYELSKFGGKFLRFFCDTSEDEEEQD